MRKIIDLVILVGVMAWNAAALAQETGVRLSPGAGVCMSGGIITACLPFKDQSGGGYTILATDNLFTIKIGTSGAILPRAGSTGFPANWKISIINVSTGPVQVNTTTSVFKGASGTTTLTLASGEKAELQSDGTDWQAVLTGNSFVPIITLPTATTHNFNLSTGNTFLVTETTDGDLYANPTCGTVSCWVYLGQVFTIDRISAAETTGPSFASSYTWNDSIQPTLSHTSLAHDKLVCQIYSYTGSNVTEFDCNLAGHSLGHGP
ncbi:MAG TPA: hypothetical protein VGK96_23100 [Candidatus Sulfotelmatobacter sp.]|jgi:hypothetical protein